jgi:hypothetical protein
MYVYIQSEHAGRDGATHDLFTVGFFRPDGKWEAESDHQEREDAAARVHFLNGGDEIEKYVEPFFVLKERKED